MIASNGAALLEPGVAVAVHEPQVVEPQAEQVGARPLEQGLDPLDRIDLARQICASTAAW